MAYLMGSLMGGFLATMLIGLLVGLAFKSHEPNGRAIRAALIGWIACGALAGFGMADGGPFRFDAILVYFPGAVIAFFYLRWHYNKIWSGADDVEELQRTFE